MGWIKGRMLARNIDRRFKTPGGEIPNWVIHFDTDSPDEISRVWLTPASYTRTGGDDCWQLLVAC